MIERELDFLAKEVPKGLSECKSKEVIDIYIPVDAKHPTLRIRKNGNKYEITKKEPVADDPTTQLEETTTLRESEYDVLSKVPGKKVHKIRYFYPVNGRTAEIDVFQGDLKGLILISFEFDTEEEKQAFVKPDFCGEYVTTEEFIAGGMICGKSYEDIKKDLEQFGYKPLFK